jgi:hypothetical protein
MPKLLSPTANTYRQTWQHLVVDGCSQAVVDGCSQCLRRHSRKGVSSLIQAAAETLGYDAGRQLPLAEERNSIQQRGVSALPCRACIKTGARARQDDCCSIQSTCVAASVLKS